MVSESSIILATFRQKYVKVHLQSLIKTTLPYDQDWYWNWDQDRDQDQDWYRGRYQDWDQVWDLYQDQGQDQKRDQDWDQDQDGDQDQNLNRNQVGIGIWMEAQINHKTVHNHVSSDFNPRQNLHTTQE